MTDVECAVKELRRAIVAHGSPLPVEISNVHDRLVEVIAVLEARPRAEGAFNETTITFPDGTEITKAFTGTLDTSSPGGRRGLWTRSRGGLFSRRSE